MKHFSTIVSLAVLAGCCGGTGGLRSDADSKYESLLRGVTWEYEAGLPDCDSSDWRMHFKPDRRLISGGGDCDLDDAWRFDAYGWHVTSGIILAYLPETDSQPEPTLLAYPIIWLDRERLIINEGGHAITFVPAALDDQW